jgi:hypothetical protein
MKNVRKDNISSFSEELVIYSLVISLFLAIYLIIKLLVAMSVKIRSDYVDDSIKLYLKNA